MHSLARPLAVHVPASCRHRVFSSTLHTREASLRSEHTWATCGFKSTEWPANQDFMGGALQRSPRNHRASLMRH